MSYEYALDPLNSRALAAERRVERLGESNAFYAATAMAVASVAQLRPPSPLVAYKAEDWERPGNDAVRMMPEQDQ